MPTPDGILTGIAGLGREPWEADAPRAIEISHREGRSIYDVTPECVLDHVSLGDAVELHHTDVDGFVYRVDVVTPPAPLTRREYLEGLH